MGKKMKNKKGFTLVEIIVVLIIVAVLAAVAVPSMLNYVEDARGQAFVAEARMGITAAQWIVTEQTALGTSEADIVTGINNGDFGFTAKVAGVADDEGFTITADDIDADFKVTGIVYNSGTYTITIGGGTTEVEKNQNP